MLISGHICNVVVRFHVLNQIGDILFALLDKIIGERGSCVAEEYAAGGAPLSEASLTNETEHEPLHVLVNPDSR